MRYTIIESLTARGNWSTVDSYKSWEEAWKSFQGLKNSNPHITYHII